MTNDIELKLRYRVDIEDMVAFQSYCARHSPEYLRQRKRLVLRVCGWILVFCLAIGVAKRDVFFIEVVTPIALVIAAAFYWATGVVDSRRIRGQYVRNPQPALAYEHTMAHTSDGVCLSMPLAESKIKYEGIHGVHCTDSHGFVFTAWNMAWVIPKARVIEGDFHAFMQALEERYHENSRKLDAVRPVPGSSEKISGANSSAISETSNDETLRLRFTVGVEDLVAFNKWYVRRDPKHWRSRWRSLVGALGVSVLLLVYAATQEKPPPSVVAGMAASVFALGLLAYFTLGSSNVDLVMRLPGHKAILGDQTLELTPQGLRHSNITSTNVVSCNGLHAVCNTGTYAFLQLEPRVPWVVPRAKIQEGDFDTFMRAVAERCGKRVQNVR